MAVVDAAGFGDAFKDVDAGQGEVFVRGHGGFVVFAAEDAAAGGESGDAGAAVDDFAVGVVRGGPGAERRGERVVMMGVEEEGVAEVDRRFEAIAAEGFVGQHCGQKDFASGHFREGDHDLVAMCLTMVPPRSCARKSQRLMNS